MGGNQSHENEMARNNQTNSHEIATLNQTEEARKQKAADDRAQYAAETDRNHQQAQDDIKMQEVKQDGVKATLKYLQDHHAETMKLGSQAITEVAALQKQLSTISEKMFELLVNQVNNAVTTLSGALKTMSEMKDPNKELYPAMLAQPGGMQAMLVIIQEAAKERQAYFAGVKETCDRVVNEAHKLEADLQDQALKKQMQSCSALMTKLSSSIATATQNNSTMVALVLISAGYNPAKFLNQPKQA